MLFNKLIQLSSTIAILNFFKRDIAMLKNAFAEKMEVFYKFVYAVFSEVNS